jgi:hypothetical protein
MSRLRPLLFLLLALCGACFVALPAAAEAEDTARIAELCLSAARRAERLAEMPEDVVTGIMLAETGRWSRARKRSYPWPWTVTSGTDAWFADSRAEAIATVRRLQAEGRRNIDVGCMQINLHWHPAAFRTIEEALDPVRNVAYGTAFLGELFAERGSWSRAVAAYHSRDPERGQAYLARVEKLQLQQRHWDRDELQTAFADTRAERPDPILGQPSAGPLWDRALARGTALLAALEAPADVAVVSAPGSLIRLRRDLQGGRVQLSRSFLFSGTPSPRIQTAER